MAQLIIEVPDAFAAEVGEALRARYPDVTADAETDGQAARAVFAWLIADILANSAAEKTRGAKMEALQAAQAELETSVECARKNARDAVLAHLKAPGTLKPTPGKENPNGTDTPGAR